MNFPSDDGAIPWSDRKSGLRIDSSVSAPARSQYSTGSFESVMNTSPFGPIARSPSVCPSGAGGMFQRRSIVPSLMRTRSSAAIVESPGFVDRFGLNMAADITLPMACAATCAASINVQRMSVQAAVTGDVDLLKLAVLHDPLVGAICSPDEVWQMVDEMLVAQARWLPQ